MFDIKFYFISPLSLLKISYIIQGQIQTQNLTDALYNTNLNTEGVQQARILARGVREHAPRENFVLTNTLSCIALHSEVYISG